MIIFWLIIILMTLVALAFVLIPLLRHHVYPNINRSSANVAIYQENLEQAHDDDQEFDVGQLSAVEAELQGNLLQDNASKEIDISAAKTSRAWISIIFILIVLPLFSILFYLMHGNSQELAALLANQKEQRAVQQLQKQLGNPQQVINTLQAHLKKDPKSAQGWYLLGRLYLSQSQFTNAADALEKAYELQPKNPQVLFQYAQALFLVQHNLDGKPEQLLHELLKLQPHNDQAIDLMAIAAFSKGDYQQAIKLWKSLLPHYPVNSLDARALRDAISRAQNSLKQQHE